MRLATPRILLMSVLSAALILAALYVAFTPRPASAPAPVLVESGRPGSAQRTDPGGLQWFGVLPRSSENKPPEPRPFGDVVAELIASRRPADALTAFGMIEGCEQLRPVFALDPLPAAFLARKKQCATIAEPVRRSKYDYLRIAAYAGTPGVGSAWLAYGPGGDIAALRTRPNDPAVVAWKEQATALVIRDGDKGDINALQDLMNGYAGKTPFFDADPSRSLAYAIAYKDIVDLLKLTGMQNQPTDADIDLLAAKLSQEQVGWAKTFAAAIVAARAKKMASTSR